MRVFASGSLTQLIATINLLAEGLGTRICSVLFLVCQWFMEVSSFEGSLGRVSQLYIVCSQRHHESRYLARCVASTLLNPYSFREQTTISIYIIMKQ